MKLGFDNIGESMEKVRDFLPIEKVHRKSLQYSRKINSLCSKEFKMAEVHKSLCIISTGNKVHEVEEENISLTCLRNTQD